MPYKYTYVNEIVNLPYGISVKSNEMLKFFVDSIYIVVIGLLQIL